MSNKVSNLAWATEFDNGMDMSVLASIADQAHDDGVCHPGSTKIDHLVKRTKWKRAGVIEAMKRLRAYKILKPIKKVNGGDVEYKIDLEKIGPGCSYSKQSVTPTGLFNEPVCETNLDQSARQTATSLRDEPPPVCQTDRSIYMEKPPLTVIDPKTVDVHAIYKALSVIGCVQACKASSPERQIELLTLTIERYKDRLQGEDLLHWAGWIANRASSKPAFSEMWAKTAAAVFEAFIPDVLQEISRRPSQTKVVILTEESDLADSVRSMFETWQTGGVAKVNTDPATVAEYVRQLRDAGIPAEVVSARSSEVVIGEQYAPSAFKVVSKLAPYAKKETKAIGYNDDFESGSLTVEQLRERLERRKLKSEEVRA